MSPGVDTSYYRVGQFALPWIFEISSEVLSFRLLPYPEKNKCPILLSLYFSLSMYKELDFGIQFHHLLFLLCDFSLMPILC